MKTAILKVVGTAICLWSFTTAALAHHSFAAQYDSNKPVSLKGFVTKIE